MSYDINLPRLQGVVVRFMEVLEMFQFRRTLAIGAADQRPQQEICKTSAVSNAPAEVGPINTFSPDYNVLYSSVFLPSSTVHGCHV